MARNMITRTITVTTVYALCLDLTTAQSYTRIFTLAGRHTDPVKIKLKLEKTFNDNTHIIAMIKSVYTNTRRYGMTTQDFIDNADILPGTETENTP